jgi:hypothetical protein
MADATPLLSTVKTDVQKAKEYKSRLALPLASICEIMTEARLEGILISWNVTADAMGKFFVAQLTATKDLDR